MKVEVEDGLEKRKAVRVRVSIGRGRSRRDV